MQVKLHRIGSRQFRDGPWRALSKRAILQAASLPFRDRYHLTLSSYLHRPRLHECFERILPRLGPDGVYRMGNRRLYARILMAGGNLAYMHRCRRQGRNYFERT